MQENHWSQIERIFNQAVELPGARKREFVVESCGGDAPLRDEILALLEEDAEPGNLLNSPAFSHGIRIFDERANLVPSDLRIPNYEILEPLGQGGMGTVYLAEDARLERLVALKLLPDTLKDDTEIVLRFQQEAKAASAISHPHVAHIYEYGQTDGHHFLAMEYVPGRTLRDVLEEKTLTKACALDIACQIADALAAAHRQGIVHRDVKPENIMLIDENFVKVLDFGLAKITAISQDEKKRLRPRRSDPNSVETVPGVILGTAAYMSPEQVRGQTVDARADVWSLGVIAYEMLAGTRPFKGATPSDIRASVLLIEPPPLDIEAGGAKTKTDAVVRRALSKQVAERFPTAEEFARELRDLHKHFESIEPCENTFDRRRPPSVSDAKRSAAGKNPLRLTLLAILMVTGVLFFTGNFLSEKTSEKTSGVNRTVRVNTGGKAVRAALSRSGELLVYALEEAGKQGLFLRRNELQTRASDVRTLLAPADWQFVGVSFAPDKKSVYYAAKKDGATFASLYRLSLDGGEPQKLLERIESAAVFSPDGGQMVFLRLSADDSHESLIIANADGSGEREFYTRRMPEYIPHPAQPAWSPDGSTIICAAGTYGADNKQQIVPVAINVRDGKAVPVFSEPWAEIWQASWTSDGGAFVITGRRDLSADNKQLWLISYPGGEAKRLTDDFNDYYGVSVERRRDDGGEQLTTMILERTSRLEQIDLSGKHLTQTNLTDAGDDGFGVSFTNGGIVYGSMADGNPDIWALDEDGTRRQLTTDAHADMYPAATADGRFIVYISERSGVKSLWRMNRDGSRQTLLASGAASQQFAVSPDSRFVYYQSYFDGAAALWRVSVEGGPAEKVAAGKFEFPTVSPDGKFILVAEPHTETNESRLVVRSAHNFAQIVSTLTPVAGINLSAAAPTPLRWTADGKEIVYVVTKKGVSNLWSQTIDAAGAAKQLTNFTHNRIYSFDLSPGNRRAVCSRGEQTRFIALLQIN